MLWFLITLLFLISTVESTTKPSIRLELAHRETLKPTPEFSRIEDTVSIDKKRHSAITHKRTDEGAKMPLGSGADLGNAQYVTEISVGTPPEKYRVVVDTGSELTWVYCRYREKGRRKASRRHRHGHRHKKGNAGKGKAENRKVFRADASKSFTPIGCSTKTCKEDLSELFAVANNCPNPSNPCTYDYRYYDGSKALGIFGNETFTFGLADGGEAKLESAIIGCSDSIVGNAFKSVDGVLGLACTEVSFASKASCLFGPKFSYCLVDHLSAKNVSNFLVFGTHSQKTGPVTTVPFNPNVIPPFYSIDIVGISLGDKMIDIPPQVWKPGQAQGGGGTILDSGSSLTMLIDDAYKAVITELDRHLVGVKRIYEKEVPLEYCYVVPVELDASIESKLPQLAFHFKNGARFEPYRKSYFVDTTVGQRCLGFLTAGAQGTNVIGNIMQQNFLWEFDLDALTVSFAPSSCT